VKFLVMWQVELGLLSKHMAAAVARMPAYGVPLVRAGKVLARYHVVGAHGGAWIYDVESHEELERLLGLAPVYNFARYQIYPLADMQSPDDLIDDPTKGDGADTNG
jgi:muconolactone delta-isomerase